MEKLLAVGLIVLCPVAMVGQGFGNLKKKIILDRKLPAAVKMPGSSFAVKVSAQNPQYMDVSDRLQSVIETQLVRFNSELTVNADRPDTIITLRVLNFNLKSTPEADPLGSSLVHSVKSSSRQPQPTANRVTGNLSVTYQARTRAGGSVDAEPIEVKFSQVFDTTSETVSKTKEMFSRIPHPGGKKPSQDDETPHTLGDVEQILVNRLAERVAARLVNTSERLEILLARGKLDENNRYAEAGQWTQFVENLEMMPPLRAAEDDAYRLYNIGVGDEALGYKAEPASARMYFERAVIQYRKAGEANVKEKYFIEPVNRIEVALEHYKKLAAPPAATPSKAPAKQVKSK